MFPTGFPEIWCFGDARVTSKGYFAGKEGGGRDESGEGGRVRKGLTLTLAVLRLAPVPTRSSCSSLTNTHTPHTHHPQTPPTRIPPLFLLFLPVGPSFPEPLPLGWHGFFFFWITSGHPHPHCNTPSPSGSAPLHLCSPPPTRSLPFPDGMLSRGGVGRVGRA